MRLAKTNTMRCFAVAMAIALTGVLSAAHAGALGAPYQPGGIPNIAKWAAMHASAGADGESVLVAGLEVNRYSSSGSPLWPVPLSIKGAVSIDAGADGSGNSVIVVETPGLNGIYATVYNRDGAVITPGFRVDQGSLINFSTPRVSVNSDGVFVVSWSRKDSETRFTRLSRTFNRNGTARGPEVVLQSGERVTTLDSSIDANGRFTNLTAHTTITPDFEYPRFALTRFDSDGNVVSPFTYVTSPPTVAYPEFLAGNLSGDQVVVWMHFTRGSDVGGIAFQRYSANGQLLGGNVVVDTSLRQSYRAKVGVADDGRFVVTWVARANLSDPDAQWALYGRQYAKDGTALGALFRIDDAPAENPLNYEHTLAMGSDGKFTVLWQQHDGSQTSLWARKYVFDNQPSTPATRPEAATH